MVEKTFQYKVLEFIFKGYHLDDIIINGEPKTALVVKARAVSSFENVSQMLAKF